MPSPVELRRALFRTVLECYHNDLSCDGLDEVRHPVKYVAMAMAKGCSEAVTAVDPRLTSTSFGAAAVMVAKKVMENAKASRAFIDVEISGSGDPSVCVSFDRNIDRNVVGALMASVGESALLCKPDDKVAPGVVSDIHMYLVEPSAEVAEAARKLAQGVVAEALSPEAQQAHAAKLLEIAGARWVKGRGWVIARSGSVVVLGTSASEALSQLQAKGDATSSAITGEDSVSEACLKLHAYVFDDALDHLVESDRGKVALASMMRVFAPNAPVVAARAHSAFSSAFAAARGLKEVSAVSREIADLPVDALAAIASPGEAVPLCESAEALASVVDITARVILLSEGIVPAHLHASLGAFIAHIKRVTRPVG